MTIVDAVTRLIPGVLGSDESAESDSFCDGLLEYPQYTRPPEFRGLAVPDILLSGNHELIRKWRRSESLRKTRLLRPDLIGNIAMTKEDRKLLAELDRDDAAPKG
jgi:tRNA (guanine37-N1)-methyltransferase